MSKSSKRKLDSERKRAKPRRGAAQSALKQKTGFSDRAEVELNVLTVSEGRIALARNLLYNMVVRDTHAVNASFDKHYGHLLNETDELFSDTAFIYLVATRVDTGLHDDYKSILAGLLSNALNSVGASLITVRNGLPTQAMVSMRQAIEICSTIIHIASDPKAQAITDFQTGKYASVKSMAQAKKAVPIIGMFWGFLSETFVHINEQHSRVQPVRPYKANDEDMLSVIACLRMAVWICYVTAELAFPAALQNNRYWKLRDADGKNAVAYSPSQKEREWAATFLGLDEIGPEDVGSNLSAS